MADEPFAGPRPAGRSEGADGHDRMLGATRSQSPRVLILWADDRSPNLGVRVLAEGASALARAVWPQCQITMQDFAPNAEGFALGRRSIGRELTQRFITRWVSGFDYVLDTGAGDSFTDIYGLKRMVMMAATQRAIREAGVPLILLPQTIGPFRTAVGRMLGVRTLRKAAAVYARDALSAEYGERLAGVKPGAGSDLVFALPPQAVEQRSGVLVNVSGLLWRPNPHVSHAEYAGEVRDLIRLLRQSGERVALLAHVLDNPSSDNDVVAARELATEFPDVEVHEPTSLSDARRIIAASRAVVGARMHACLNALSQGVPALPWAYSRKFEPLFSDIGWSHTVDLRHPRGAAERSVKMLSEPSVNGEAERANARGRWLLDAVVRDFARTFGDG